MHECGKGIIRASTLGLGQLGNDHAVLSYGIEGSAVATEPALVGKRSGDIRELDLVGVWIERVHPAARDSLQIGAGGGRAGLRIAHPEAHIF